MTIDDLRERARQMCELGHLVSDERARLEAEQPDAIVDTAEELLGVL